MRTIHIDQIVKTIEQLCIDANYYINDDIMEELNKALKTEQSQIGVDIIQNLIKNALMAKERKIAICQDTGMAVVFMDVGQDVHIVGGNLIDSINEGVRKGYENGYLRKSVVGDPIERVNTKDNTPAVIHFNIIEGDRIKISVAPKGFGSENMSSIKMLKPSDGIEGIKKFIIDTIDIAGPNPCPPIIVGVGIGGTMEKAAILAKKALLRPINKRNDLNHIKEIENDVLKKINMLGIGPSGLGGRITALAVNIEVFSTHIAGLPVAVNISCHATRHADATI
ncbi:UNVERIFIED_CONTAM: fumarate hydratase subunit alpha [Acetivibrio alkalicellulosi]